jgi:protein-L-isoaspartate O-methyltransferase
VIRIALLALASAISAISQPQTAGKLVPYYPTPQTIVRKMLELGELKPGEKMFDLGSGDGRIVIMAAQKFKADATGVELDDELARESSARIKKLGIQSRARIIHGDILKQDYSSADLITVYLLPNAIDRQVTPILEEQLHSGTRVVSHDFEFSSWKPVQVVDIDDDGKGRSHRIYVYRR